MTALFILAIYGCEADDPDPSVGCPTLPVDGSNEESLLTRARTGSRFALLFPCYLPNAQRLTNATVIGIPGRQQAEFVFNGPFDLTLRQAQFPPAVSPDPAGASRVVVSLAPNIPATLIERYDGSSKAMYHLLWEQDRLFYEVQAVGPPQQRRAILEVAKSMQPAGPSLFPTALPVSPTRPPGTLAPATTPAAGTTPPAATTTPTPGATAATPTATVVR